MFRTRATTVERTRSAPRTPTRAPRPAPTACTEPRHRPELPLPDQLHPDAATHRRMGERFAALAFGSGGPFAAEQS